ncbi:MAG: ThuA domain-containing protein, partial [Planctomycetota bacterium]
HHPNEKGVDLIGACLESSPNVPGLRCLAFHHWPEDPSVLDQAACIVLYTEGTNKKGKPHPALQGDRIEHLDRLMARGVGLVCIHYTLYATREVEAPKLLAWVGGYYDFQGYGSRHWVSRAPLLSQRATPEHPISRGWDDFTLPANEYYHHLKFADGAPVVPIVTADIRDRKTRQAQRHVIGWALERPDGGRGFGFGGGHFHGSWAVEGYRRMLLNAVVWAAGVEVPEGGVKWAVSDEQLGLKKTKGGK